MSRPYEAVFIFDSSLDDTVIQEKLAHHQALLSASELTNDIWGRRQLAYKIGRRETGFYVVSRFSCDPKVLPEFERSMKLDDGVVRYLITIHEHELGAPPLTEEELAARRDLDDDDED